MDPSSDSRLIHPTEITLVLDLLKDVGWELTKRWNKDGISLFCHKGFSVGGGNIFGKTVYDFPPEFPAGHVLKCLEDFDGRHLWDHWCGSVYIANVLGENDVIHGHIHASPYSTRDYLIYSASWRRQRDGAMLTYCRPAPDCLSPVADSVVRAKLHCSCILMEGRPEGGVRLTVTSLVDLGLPFVPLWLANWFVPREFRNWGMSFKSEIVRRLAEWNPNDSRCARYAKLMMPLQKSDTGKSIESTASTQATETKAESDKDQSPKSPSRQGNHDDSSQPLHLPADPSCNEPSGVVAEKASGTTATQVSQEAVVLEAESEVALAACCWTPAPNLEIPRTTEKTFSL